MKFLYSVRFSTQVNTKKGMAHKTTQLRMQINLTEVNEA